jgi:hypothetical protein
VTVAGAASASVEATFEAIVPIQLSKMFTGYRVLPAVSATREQTGGWDHVGASRVVDLADGSSAREEITAYEPPSYFAYRVTGFTSPLRALVLGATGEWWFSAGDRETTAIRWRYTFEPRGVARPIVASVIARLWRGYARKALALAVREAEREET